LPWRLQLRNNWQNKEEPSFDSLKPPTADDCEELRASGSSSFRWASLSVTSEDEKKDSERQNDEEEIVLVSLAPQGGDKLKIELPMMVGCYQYHFLINGVTFCDTSRPYRHNEDFGDSVNFFTLWSESPFATAWPGLHLTTKLEFPFKVEIRGSWGEQIVECTMNLDGTLDAHLPNLHPGVYHYHFLINGQQFCDKSRFYQQYFFGCYNLLQLTDSGTVNPNFTLAEESSPNDLKRLFPDKLVSSCISILELWELQHKEWEHPCKLSDRFNLADVGGPVKNVAEKSAQLVLA